jgi:hypothetical protein
MYNYMYNVRNVVHLAQTYCEADNDEHLLFFTNL